jgi:hypothetical protein
MDKSIFDKACITVNALTNFADTFDPYDYSVEEATRMVTLFGEMEQLIGAMAILTAAWAATNCSEFDSRLLRWLVSAEH